MPLAGGDPEVVDTENGAAFVAAGERGVYWVAGAGARVKFLPKGSATAKVLADIMGISKDRSRWTPTRST